MNFKTTKLDIESTGYFSTLVKDYQQEDIFLKDLIVDFPSFEAIAKTCETRLHFPMHREVLVKALQQQYQGIECHDKVIQAINLLKQDNTFTICTAHQPSIFTGHLYFIYKIIHAIKLAEECSRQISSCQFVPVYYMGSEDNDIDEIGLLHYQGETFHWTNEEKGACGRMSTASLQGILSAVLVTLNRNISEENEIMEILSSAYNGQHTLAQGTRILVNYLFGEMGLVIIDGDDPILKKLFVPVLQKECFEQLSYDQVATTNSKIAERYTPQATARELNLFYLRDGLRERLERKEENWEVINSDIQFDAASLQYEIEHYPERFSPNVILRPVYQETILPNVAFIGGGGELAYWLQLKGVFTIYKTSYPIVCLRHSVLWMNQKQQNKMQEIGLQLADLFLPEHKLFKRWFGSHQAIQQLDISLATINEQYDKLEKESVTLSSSLERSVKAHRAKANHIHERMKTKFVAQLKRNENDKILRYRKLKKNLFPKQSLQERHNNFLDGFKEFHHAFIQHTSTMEGSPKAAFYVFEAEE